MVKAVIDVTDEDYPYSYVPKLVKEFVSREAAILWCKENSGGGYKYDLEKVINGGE